MTQTLSKTIKPAFICDLDGTLALFKDQGHRGPFEYDKVNLDAVNEPVAELVRALHSQGYVPVYVSGRERWCRIKTMRWLDQHDLPSYLPLMRASGDRRPDSVVKRELFDQIPPDLEIRFVLDDRDSVVQMWRDMGLVCLQVAEGNF